MSGYGGGWSDPHHYQQPYGQPGREQHGQHGQYGPDYGYGPPGVPQHRVDNTAAIVALVCNAVSTVLCCNLLSIAGIVTAALAIGKTRTQPRESRTLVIWSWVILGVSIAIYIVVMALLITTGVFESDPSDDPYDYGGI